jgi:hypothetical protein
VKNEERISKLVADFHTPVVAGLQLAIDILESLSGDHRRLFPRSVLIQQLFTLKIGLVSVMVDVKEIPGHAEAMSVDTKCSDFGFG